MGAWSEESHSTQQLLADLIGEVKDLTTEARNMVTQLERSFTVDPDDVTFILTSCMAVLSLLENCVDRAHSIYMTGSSQIALADAASVLRSATTKLKGIK